MQEKFNSIANALELRLSCINPLIWGSFCEFYVWSGFYLCNCHAVCYNKYPGIGLGMHPANESRCYIVRTSLIGWTHTWIDPWISTWYDGLYFDEPSYKKNWALFQYKNHLSRYGDFHYKDETDIRPSYLYNENSYTGKMVSLAPWLPFQHWLS